MESVKLEIKEVQGQDCYSLQPVCKVPSAVNHCSPLPIWYRSIFLVPCMMVQVQLLIASPLQDGLSTFTDEYPFQKPIVIRDIFVSVCLYAFLNFLKRL